MCGDPKCLCGWWYITGKICPNIINDIKKKMREDCIDKKLD